MLKLVRKIVDMIAPLIPVSVDVKIGLPNYGIVSEQYSMFDANDLACWKINGQPPRVILNTTVNSIRVPFWRVKRYSAKRQAALLAAKNIDLSFKGK